MKIQNIVRLSLVLLGYTAMNCLAFSQGAKDVDTTRNESDAFTRCAKILNYGDIVDINRPSKVDAVIALGLMGDERAVPLLIEHLQNESNNHLKMNIVRALGWLHSKKAIPALEEALKDKYPFTRKGAATVLKELTGKEYDYDKTGIPNLKKMQEAMKASMSEKQ